jgi:hypothetical protein
MQTPLSLLPDSPTLTARLGAALNSESLGSLNLLQRKRPRYMSTFPNEVVTCQLPDGSKRRLFCKYEAGRSHYSYGHRGGLAYEAQVYQRVLHSSSNFRPALMGAHTDQTNGGTWLFFEYLDRCTRLKDIRVRLKGISQPVALALAARWLGQFHKANQARLANGSASFLKRYDADYYAGWVRRTWEFAKPLRGTYPWLKHLCKHGSEIFAPLLAALPTVVHGEFYINNILVRGSRVFPVDWESTAIGAGEIDLAALIEGPWREAVVHRCEREYKRSRWTEGAPEEFSRTFDAARLYLHFRWLGDRPEWTTREKSRWRFQELRLLTKRLGIG